MRLVLIVPVIAAILAGAGWCQETAPADTDGPLVSTYGYGFNEDADRDGQPDFWTRTLDRDRPAYVPCGLDFSVQADGGGALRMSAGGASAEYLSPSIPIESGAAYDVTTSVKTGDLPTSGMRATAACVEARLFDAQGQLLAALKCLPEMSGSSDWRSVSLVDISRKHPAAASLRVALMLNGAALHGAAWFDKVEVTRRPMAFFRTSGPANILSVSREKTFHFEGRGLPAGEYALNLAVVDPSGRKAHSVSLAANAGIDGAAALVYKLPDLATGPYSIEVDLSREGVSVLKQTVSIGVVPDYPESEPARNFGLTLTSMPEDFAAALALCAASGAAWLKVPLTTGDASVKTSYMQALAAVRREGITPIGVIDLPPGARPDETDESAPGAALLRVILDGQASWSPVLADTVNSFAGSVRWWQMGRDGDVALAQLAVGGEGASVRSFIGDVCFQASVGLPSDRSSVTDAPGGYDFFSVSAPTLLTSAEARGGETSAVAGGRPLWAWIDVSEYLRLPPAESAAQAAADVAGLLAAGAQVVFVNDPWRPGGLLDSEGNVTPFALALMSLMHQLANHAYSGTFAFPNGTPNAIFTLDGRKKVLLWPLSRPREERLFLGDSVEMIDMYGRRSRVQVEDGENVLLVNDGPVILEGVDAGIVETRKTFLIEPEMIESVYEVQPVYVNFTNMFAAAIVGELALQFPEGWEAQPKVFFVRLKPGESFRGRANLIVPYNALTGLQEITAVLNIGGTQKTRIVRRRDLGSTAFRMEMESHVSGADLTIYQKVANISAEPADVSAFLEAPGLERVERLPRRLDAGSTTTFSYTLADPSSWEGKTLRVSIRERATNRFLNMEFAVPAGGQAQ